MPWYKFTIPSEQSALISFEILEKCNELLGCSGNEKVAVFLSRDLIQDRTYYLSPAAYSFLQPLSARFGAEPCDQPDKDSVSMLWGDVLAEDIL